jgi:glycosyltransferase involved in cell wall biosynthesis
MSIYKSYIPGLVTVIMPTFNHEDFVAEALLSVFNQAYADVELLVIDDCSSDQTFRIIQTITSNRRFARRFRRLVVQRNQLNAGAPDTLNVGVAAAAGEFITFINSDDVYQPNRLNRMVSKLASSDQPFLAFSAVRLLCMRPIDAEIRSLKYLLEDGPERFISELPSLSAAFLRHQLTGTTGNILVNNNLLRKVGGFGPLMYCHDWDFMLRAILFTEPTYVQDTCYMYRIHSSNTFNRLKNVAMGESAAVLAGFFRRISCGYVKNPYAPTPNNWPHVFEMLLKQFEIYDAWVEETKRPSLYARRQLAHRSGRGHQELVETGLNRGKPSGPNL